MECYCFRKYFEAAPKASPSFSVNSEPTPVGGPISNSNQFISRLFVETTKRRMIDQPRLDNSLE